MTSNAVDQVPGFGQTLTSALVACRRRIEAQFRFDPSKGVNPAAVAAIDQKYALQRTPIEKLLLVGSQQLAQIHIAAKPQRATLKEAAVKLTQGLAQAKADSAAVQNDRWPVIVTVVLIVGFIFRFALGGMQRPEPAHTAKQVVEPPGIASDADASGAKIYQPDSALSQKPPPKSGESARDIAPTVALRQQTKPAANDELLRRGRYPVLMMLGQARVSGGLENEAQIELTRAQIEALPHPLRGDRETAHRFNKDGLAMLNRGEIPEAVSNLQLAYTADPSDVEVAGNLGYAYLLARDLHQADAFLVYAIGLAPAQSSTWAKLGQLFAAKEDLELAEAALAHSLRFSQSRSKTRLLLTQLAAAHPGTTLSQAIRHVLDLPFPGFTAGSPTTSTRSH